MENLETIKLNDKEYVLKTDILTPSKKLDGLVYSIIRTYSAGVFAGYVKSREGKEGILLKTRRLWEWAGALEITQLAVHGVRNPEKCIFSCVCEERIVTEIIEVVPCTEKARLSLEGVHVTE